jgi:drug/metabolite transporter (DMT)-like permease
MKLAAALAIVYVVWGSTYLGMSVADRTLPPFLMLSVRFLVAGALLYLWARRRGELAERPGRREWGAAGLVGTTLLVVDTGGVAWAVQRVPSGTAALLVASVPLFMAVIDRLWFGVRIPAGAAAGIATGLVGVSILAGPAGSADLAGVGVLLVASLSWAAGSAYLRSAPLPQGPFAGAAMQMLTAGLALGVIGAATGEVGQVDVSRISGVSVASVLFLIVFGSLLAFTSYVWLLGNAPISLVGTYAYVNPAVAVLLGVLFAGEHATWAILLGGLIIIVGVGLVVSTERPSRPEAAPEPAPADVLD